jgi:hypothetical protein
MKIEFNADDNDILYDVLNAMFIAQLKSQLKLSREDIETAWNDEDRDATQGIINACLVLLAYYGGKNEVNDLIDDEGLIPLGD